MQLTKTGTGNYAKQVTLSRPAKRRFCGNFGTLEKAQEAAAMHRAKGRKVYLMECVTSKSQSRKYGVPEGTVFWRVDACISRNKQVMVHASASECVAAGKVPGVCNG